MSVTSKSPKAVLLTALKIARRSLPAYGHKYSPRKFTQHQLFACLVLKNFLKTDYRGVTEHLRDCPSLTEVIELKQIPHFTTLQKAAKRLLVSQAAQRLLDATVNDQMGRRTIVPDAAIDSTGLGATCASAYFVKRRSRKENPWKTMVYHRRRGLRLRIQSCVCTRRDVVENHYPATTWMAHQQTRQGTVSSPDPNTLR